VWNADAFLNCSNCANPQALPDSTRIFIVTGTDQFGCTASDSVQINIVQPVYINLAASGDTLCQGNSVQLNASGASFYSWQPVTGLNSASIANPIASPSGSIVYTVIGSSDINNCFTDTATVNILVAPNPVFSIKDTMVTINVGSSYTILTDNSADINQWSWLPPAGLSCSNCPQPVAQPKASISYQVEVANQFGCKATGNIRFEVICNNTNIFIPNTFSPNADGVNDYFYPRGKGLYTLKSIRIFNRWGGVVFAGNNILPESEKDGWNGKVNNMPQPSDVYVYVIEVLCDNGTVLNYKGSLTLIR
jgi:gliding motility-associated-like protein